jgi:hypothetical protein
MRKKGIQGRPDPTKQKKSVSIVLDRSMPRDYEFEIQGAFKTNHYQFSQADDSSPENIHDRPRPEHGPLFSLGTGKNRSGDQ